MERREYALQHALRVLLLVIPLFFLPVAVLIAARESLSDGAIFMAIAIWCAAWFSRTAAHVTFDDTLEVTYLWGQKRSIPYGQITSVTRFRPGPWLIMVTRRKRNLTLLAMGRVERTALAIDLADAGVAGRVDTR